MLHDVFWEAQTLYERLKCMRVSNVSKSSLLTNVLRDVQTSELRKTSQMYVPRRNCRITICKLLKDVHISHGSVQFIPIGSLFMRRVSVKFATALSWPKRHTGFSYIRPPWLYRERRKVFWKFCVGLREVIPKLLNWFEIDSQQTFLLWPLQRTHRYFQEAGCEGQLYFIFPFRIICQRVLLVSWNS